LFEIGSVYQRYHCGIRQLRQSSEAVVLTLNKACAACDFRRILANSDRSHDGR